MGLQRSEGREGADVRGVSRARTLAAHVGMLALALSRISS